MAYKALLKSKSAALGGGPHTGPANGELFAFSAEDAHEIRLRKVWEETRSVSGACGVGKQKQVFKYEDFGEGTGIAMTHSFGIFGKPSSRLADLFFVEL